MGLQDMRLEDMGLEGMRLEVVELEDVNSESCGCWALCCSILCIPELVKPKAPCFLNLKLSFPLISRQKWQKKVTKGWEMMFLMVCAGAAVCVPTLNLSMGGIQAHFKLQWEWVPLQKEWVMLCSPPDPPAIWGNPPPCLSPTIFLIIPNTSLSGGRNQFID